MVSSSIAEKQSLLGEVNENRHRSGFGGEFMLDEANNTYEFR